MTSKYSNKYKNIGLLIKYYRKLKGLTQDELANKAGISKSYLSKIEAQNCEKPFSLEVLFEISDALDVPITYLLDSDKNI